MAEENAHRIAAALEPLHLIAEPRLDRSWKRSPDDFGQVAPWKTGEAAMSCSLEWLRREATGATPVGMDKAHFLDVVAAPDDFWQQSHSFDEVKALSPEIDHVPTGSKLRGKLDD